MKRSIVLLITNILAALHGVLLIVQYLVPIIQDNGEEMGEIIDYAAFYRQLTGNSGPEIFIYTFIFYLIACIFGAVLGVIGYFGDNMSLSKLATFLYVVGTICSFAGMVAFPDHSEIGLIGFISALPITIFWFVGISSQKKINEKAEAQNNPVYPQVYPNGAIPIYYQPQMPQGQPFVQVPQVPQNGQQPMYYQPQANGQVFYQVPMQQPTATAEVPQESTEKVPEAEMQNDSAETCDNQIKVEE